MFKFITEFCPLIAFFVGYKIGGIITATIYLLAATVTGLLLAYAKNRTVNKVNLISSILLLISASLTLFSGNSIFIKMKPTVLYLVFSAIFLATNYKWKPAIWYVLHSAITLKDDKSWIILNWRFMWFFLLMALLNESVWRNFPEETWVNFKVFGALPITLMFVTLQMPFILKNRLVEES